MAKISKNKLVKEVEKFIWNRLLEAVSESKDEVEAEKILDDLLTPSEKIILSKRLSIALLLSRDFTYSQIKGLLKVSASTITSVKNATRRKGEGYERILRRIGRSEDKSVNLLNQHLKKIS